MMQYWFVVLLLSLALTRADGSDLDARGVQFIGFTNFSAFSKSGTQEVVLTSPEIVACINWDELIPSWNVDLPPTGYLKAEVRAIYPDHATKFFNMGLWSADPKLHPRESVLLQQDADGDVATDTLKLKRSGTRLQLRLTLGSDEERKPELKFIGLSLADGKASPAPLPPNRVAWGKVLAVPERSQMAYTNGEVLCSPTTVSMILGYWSQALKRPELDRDVPEIEKAIYDRQWKGTGNWSFNMAYAGSCPGFRAYVARLSDLAEVEDWIAAGLPVGLSICYDRLRGKGPGPSGHLVVCVGFTTNGEPIINDPGTSTHVRKTFPRQNLIQAWSYSRNAAYLIYPDDAALPEDRFGHWAGANQKPRQ